MSVVSTAPSYPVFSRKQGLSPPEIRAFPLTRELAEGYTESGIVEAATEGEWRFAKRTTVAPRLSCAGGLEVRDVRRQSILVLVSAAVFSVAPGFSTTAVGDFYHVVDLGALDPEHKHNQGSSARAINDSGQVVGGGGRAIYSAAAAVLFDSTGHGDNIILAWGGEVVGACSINNSGQIVGEGWSDAILFDPTGQGNNIHLGSGRASSINDGGLIVGSTGPQGGGERATLFDATGHRANVFLGTLGGAASSAQAINNDGQIVGWAANSSGSAHATLFDPTGNGQNVDLGLSQSGANSINDHGQIVGYSVGDGYRAVLFDPTGQGNNIDLGPGIAWSINNSGQVVGGIGRPLLYDITGQGNNVDLRTRIVDPGFNFAQAWAINDSGWIAGAGWNAANEFHAALLKPIPAPIADAGGPYLLDLAAQQSIVLGGSVEGEWSQAVWDLNGDGLFTDATGLQPLLSIAMMESWGFSPGMTWDIGLRVTALYGDGVDISMTQVTFVPIPGAALLGAIGLSCAGWRLRRRTC